MIPTPCTALIRRVRSRVSLSDESGLSIVEVLVSSLIMVTIAVSVFGALEATGRAGAEERHRARAYGIAQDDQVRLRSMNVPQLSDRNETNVVTQDGIKYTVVSTGVPAIDRSTTSSCTSGNTSADYIAISSTVTWPSIGSRPPVVIDSIVAPPNGSLPTNRGALAVQVLDSRSNPNNGVTISGSGASTFSGTTTNGCAIWGNLPTGSYTITPSKAGQVDKDGNTPPPISTTVSGQSANTIPGLQYDAASGFTVGFRTIKSRPGVAGDTTTATASTGDAIRIFNSGMTQAKNFGTVGTYAGTIKATSLFPFVSPYAIYAGSCDTNNPTSGLAFGSYAVPVGQVAPATANVTLQLPALNLTVYRGTSSQPGALASGARVTITDPNCLIGGVAVKRTYTTNASGKLDDPGLPWGVYNVCASGASGTTTTIKRATTTGTIVKNPATPTTLNLYLNQNGNLTGACP